MAPLLVAAGLAPLFQAPGPRPSAAGLPAPQPTATPLPAPETAPSIAMVASFDAPLEPSRSLLAVESHCLQSLTCTGLRTMLCTPD